MADTGGIAALLKALNDTPGLGAGLKPAAARAASASASSFAATAGISQPSGAASTSSSASTAASRPIRVAASASKPAPGAKNFIADGKTYDVKAPRGSYINIVI